MKDFVAAIPCSIPAKQAVLKSIGIDPSIYTERELNKASAYFRTMLAERLDIRHTPEIKFIYDESQKSYVAAVNAAVKITNYTTKNNKNLKK